MDKNEATIEFLLQCPTIQADPLFFNFATEENDTNHFITETDSSTGKTFIDGSVLKQYTFTIASYKAISHNALVGTSNFGDENMEAMAKVQEILDWINEQAELNNFPDFGSNCQIEEMQALTDDPDLDGIDRSVDPPLVRYSIGVRLKYLDTSKVLWNK